MKEEKRTSKKRNKKKTPHLTIIGVFLPLVLAFAGLPAGVWSICLFIVFWFFSFCLMACFCFFFAPLFSEQQLSPFSTWKTVIWPLSWGQVYCVSSVVAVIFHFSIFLFCLLFVFSFVGSSSSIIAYFSCFQTSTSLTRSFPVKDAMQ